MLRRTTLAVLVAMAAFSAGCATSIRHVLADPARYRNQDVRVSGRVVDSYAIADRGAYLVEDRSGRLWIVSDRGVPRRGARVSARGTIREAFNLGAFGRLIRLPIGTDPVVMIEDDRHAR